MSKNAMQENTMNSLKSSRLDALLDKIEQLSSCMAELKNKQKKNPKPGPKSAKRKPQREDSAASSIQFDETPEFINGEMRDYQLVGLNWLISLYKNGANGILADEMGLGKTLQTISFLSLLKAYQQINGPFLVIAPKSTINNWMNEIRRFSGNLCAVALIGDKPQRLKIKEAMQNPRVKWDVCVTNYEMITNEKAFLKKIHWHYVVVDEGHRMKNEFNNFSKILRTFKTDNRLIITGTPLQNTLHELWALLNYLMPHMFGSSADFDAWFDSDDCLAGNDDVVSRLKKILEPFMLRRIKAEVEKSLLPKLEVKLFVGLTALQRDVYCRVLRKEVFQTNSQGEQSLKGIKMILTELRKAANHPYLIDNIEPKPHVTDANLIKCCGKMMVLDKLLTKLKEQGSRVLIFSQFVIMLDILDDYLNFRGHNYRRLDGETSFEQRAVDIDDFNAPNSDIFLYLISTRAGGLGINLATADSVIMYDSDWNPQSDAQAIDRVHRIGQTKQVRVFRLVTENTIDERIVQRAEIKLRLDRMVIKNTKVQKKENNSVDKIDIIRFGADQILSDDYEEIIDVDIEQILQNGTVKTNAENEKYAKMKENELRNYTLQQASSLSLYKFEGVDYKQITSASVETASSSRPIRAAALQNQQSSEWTSLEPFQFFPPSLILLCLPGTMKLDMSKDTEIKKELLNEGFPNWTRSDFNKFCDALIKYGSENIEKVRLRLPDKSLEEITRYAKAFLEQGPHSLDQYPRIMRAMIASEKLRASWKKKVSVFQWKFAQYTDPATEMIVETTTSPVSSKKGPKDDALIRLLYEVGIDSDDVFLKIQNRIHSLPIYENDASMRNLSEKDISKKINDLFSVIKKEQDDEKAKNKAKKKTTEIPPKQTSPANDLAAEPTKSAGSPNNSGVALTNDAKISQSDAMETSQNVELEGSDSINVSIGKDDEKTLQAKTSKIEKTKAKSKEQKKVTKEESLKQQKMNETHPNDGQNGVVAIGGTTSPLNNGSTEINDKMAELPSIKQEPSSPLNVSNEKANTSQASNAPGIETTKPVLKKKQKKTNGKSPKKPANKKQKMNEAHPNDDQKGGISSPINSGSTESALNVSNEKANTSQGSNASEDEKTKPVAKKKKAGEESSPNPAKKKQKTMPKSVLAKREAKKMATHEAHDGPSPPKKKKKN